MRSINVSERDAVCVHVCFKYNTFNSHNVEHGNRTKRAVSTQRVHRRPGKQGWVGKQHVVPLASSRGPRFFREMQRMRKRPSTADCLRPVLCCSTFSGGLSCSKKPKKNTDAPTPPTHGRNLNIGWLMPLCVSAQLSASVCRFSNR